MRIVPSRHSFVGWVWANAPVGVTKTESSGATSILCMSSSMPRNARQRPGAAQGDRPTVLSHQLGRGAAADRVQPLLDIYKKVAGAIQEWPNRVTFEQR